MRWADNGEMVTVRYWAAARAASGIEAEDLDAATVGDLLAAIAAKHEIARVLAACSLLVDGLATRADDGSRRLTPGAVVDVLPPFAGG